MDVWIYGCLDARVRGKATLLHRPRTVRKEGRAAQSHVPRKPILHDARVVGSQANRPAHMWRDQHHWEYVWKKQTIVLSDSLVVLPKSFLRQNGVTRYCETGSEKRGASADVAQAHKILHAPWQLAGQVVTRSFVTTGADPLASRCSINRRIKTATTLDVPRLLSFELLSSLSPHAATELTT